MPYWNTYDCQAACWMLMALCVLLLFLVSNALTRIDKLERPAASPEQEKP